MNTPKSTPRLSHKRDLAMKREPELSSNKLITKPNPEADPLLLEILKVAAETRDDGESLDGVQGGNNLPILAGGFLAFKQIYRRICDEAIEHEGVRHNIAEKCHEQNLQAVDALVWMAKELQIALVMTFMDHRVSTVALEAAQIVLGNSTEDIEFDLRYRALK